MMRRYAINDMGLLYYFLSIKVYQDDGVVFICQKKFAERILRMFSCKPVDVPLLVNENLIKDDGGKKMDG
jgi:hypothetical protein